MHEGRYCRYLRFSGTIRKPDMGTMKQAEYVAHMLWDAASPEQIEDLAAQCLDMAQRLKRTSHPAAAEWKKSWKECKAQAEEARERLARFPTEKSHPHFFMKKTVGAPGLLYDDVRLPLFLRLHLPMDEVSVGTYETPIRNNTIYHVAGLRDLCAWLEPVGQDHLPTYKRKVSKVPGPMLKGMLALGRIEAVDPALAGSQPCATT